LDTGKPFDWFEKKKVEGKLSEENFLNENDEYLTVGNLSSLHDCDKQNPVALHRHRMVEKPPIIDRKSSEHMKLKLSQITRTLSASVNETCLLFIIKVNVDILEDC
jgi:hypothetical protein